jgi:hypothetical protein
LVGFFRAPVNSSVRCNQFISRACNQPVRTLILLVELSMLKKHLLGLLVASLAFASMVFVYHKTRCMVGIVEASIDIFRGKYIIKAYGRLAAVKDEHNTVLKEFGVEVVAVGGCTVTDDLLEEIQGYNSISVDAIDEKFGDTLWKRLRERLGTPNSEQEREKSREFARQCKLQARQYY